MGTLLRLSTFTASKEKWKQEHRAKDVKLNNAFLHLQSAASRSQKPDPARSTQLLYDLCKANRVHKAVRVMELMVNSGVAPDAAAYSFLVERLCRRGGVGHAMQLVERMAERGLPASGPAYNSLVRGLCARGRLSRSLHLLERLVAKGLVPDEFTYSFLLQATYKERGANEAIKLLDRIVSGGGSAAAPPNLVSYNVLLTALCKERRTDEAVLLFRRLPALGFRPNTVSHNILLRCLCNDARWAEAGDILSEMMTSSSSSGVNRGVEKLPSAVTYNILIDSLASQGMTSQALAAAEEMSRARFRLSAASFNPIVARLCLEGRVGPAAECLALMTRRRCEPNEGTYNAVAAGLCRAGMVREAYSMVQTLGCGRDHEKSVVVSLCKRGNALAALQLMGEMTRFGFTPDTQTYSSLIQGLCGEGMVGAAMEIYAELASGSGDIEGYLNAVVLGLCKSGRAEGALAVLEDAMVGAGFVPREATYTIVVEGIARDGETEIAAQLLRELHVLRVMTRTTVERLDMQYHLEVFAPRLD